MKKETNTKNKKEVEKKPLKKIQKEDSKNIYIYILAMTFILIISNILGDYVIQIGGYDISASMFSYPFVYLFAVLITKEYGKEKALTAILIASMIQAGLYLGTALFRTTATDSVVLTGSIISFIASQIILVFLYDSLSKENKISAKAALFITYVFVILIDNMIYLIVFRTGTMFDNEMPYIISSAIKALFALAFTFGQYMYESTDQ